MDTNAINTYVTGFSLSPAESWILVIMLIIGAFAITYTIAYIDQTIHLVVLNRENESTPKAIWHAVRAIEIVEIRKKQVISISARRNCYRALTTDGKKNYRYTIIPVREDTSSPYYMEAKELAGKNRLLFERLKPDSRVINELVVRSNGSEQHLIFMYLRVVNNSEIENTLSSYFEEVFEKESREMTA